MHRKPVGLQREGLHLLTIVDAEQLDARTTVSSLVTPAAPLTGCQVRPTVVYFGTRDKWKDGSIRCRCR
jgi:hypothetical protein